MCRWGNECLGRIWTESSRSFSVQQGKSPEQLTGTSSWITCTQYKIAIHLAWTETFSWSGMEMANTQVRDHTETQLESSILNHSSYSWHIGAHTSPCFLNKNPSAKTSVRNVPWQEIELLWSSMKQSKSYYAWTVDMSAQLGMAETIQILKR